MIKQKIMRRIAVPLYAAVIAFVSASVCANPCVWPRRMIGNRTVDLQPLMNWWQEPKGERPLSAWKHVQGTIARDIPYGWVLEVKREDEGQVQRFFLKNPPRERLRRFQELQTELTELQKARAIATELISRPVYTDLYSSYLTQWSGPAQSLFEYHEVETALLFIHQKISAINSELEPMQDLSGVFKLDAFALKCNESFEGLPVYDYGSTAPFEY